LPEEGDLVEIADLSLDLSVPDCAWQGIRPAARQRVRRRRKRMVFGCRKRMVFGCFFMLEGLT
jgi:hypothetical protein